MHIDQLEHVLAALDRGLSLIPVNSNKQPYKNFSWRPYQYTRAREDEIRHWQVALQPWAWAIVTGKISGAFAADFDGYDGLEILRRLELPQAHVETPRGGRHLYVEHPGWPVKTIQSQSGGEWARRWKGLDLRGDGGYVVAIGPGYRWLRDFEPVPFEALPRELRDAINRVSGGSPAGMPAASRPPNGMVGLATNASSPTSGDALATQALSQVGAGRNQAGFLYARSLFRAGVSREQAEVRGLSFVAEANRRQPLNQYREQEEYTLDEFLMSVRSVYNLADRADAIASKALEDGLKGASLAVLVSFVGLMLETGRDVLTLARRPLMVRAGIKSRQTVDKAVKEVMSRGYLSYAGTATDGTLRYRVECVHRSGQESVDYLSVSVLARFVHLEAFYHRALGKHVLATLALIVSASDGLGLDDLVARGPFQRRTHKRHTETLLNYALIYEDGGKFHAAFDALDERLCRLPAQLGTEGERGAMVACFERQRKAYKAYRRGIDQRLNCGNHLAQETN